MELNLERQEWDLDMDRDGRNGDSISYLFLITKLVFSDAHDFFKTRLGKHPKRPLRQLLVMRRTWMIQFALFQQLHGVF